MLLRVAARTQNFSGAELEGLVKSATSFALNRQERQPSIFCFLFFEIVATRTLKNVPLIVRVFVLSGRIVYIL